MTDAVTAAETTDSPWRSTVFWWVMGVLGAAIMALTMVKDQALSGERPNPLFYLTVPLVSILGGTLGGFATARLLRQMVRWVDVLAITLITNLLGQIWENVSKLVWYLVWEYPGWLYLLAVLLLGLIVPAFCLVRWPKLRWSMALVIAMGMFLGEMVLGLAFTAITGIATPGS